MYLKRLIIYENINRSKVIRNIPFNKTGLNIVVDKGSQKDGKGNNVGKTSFLTLIDLCLGAKTPQQLWLDADTGSVNEKLRDYIENAKISTSLVINHNDSDIVLTVDLFNKGKKYINNIPLHINDYWKSLNHLLFENDSPPTFRQLIGKFVRINQSDSPTKVLRYVHGNTPIRDYQNIYDFLFQLSDSESSSYRLILQQEIHSLTQEFNTVKKRYDFKNIDTLLERKIKKQYIVETVSNQINSLVHASRTQAHTEKLGELYLILRELEEKINIKKFHINKIEKIIDNSLKSDLLIDLELLEDFYAEVSTLMWHVPRKFEELMAFNQALKFNKEAYYKDRLNELKLELATLSDEKNELQNSNKSLFRLIETENIETFTNLNHELVVNSTELGAITNALNIALNIENSIFDKKAQLTQIEKLSSEKQNNLEIFNEFFKKITSQIIDQPLMLHATNSGFPLKLLNIDDGIGTGYRKTITLLMDIAYVYFIQSLNLPFPRFIVHDILETVDRHRFQKIQEEIMKSGTQFIFAILEEKIRDYNFITDDDIILRLSDDDKLFKI